VEAREQRAVMPHRPRGAVLALVVQLLAAACSCGYKGAAGAGSAPELSALWFYRTGVTLQVADEAGAEPCLRAFRAAARLLSDAPGDVAAPGELYELVQNASREVALRDKARRVGGTLMMGAEIHDGVGPVALQWVLGDDLRDIADFACCANMEAVPPRCFEYNEELAAARPAPAWRGGRGMEEEEAADSCASYVLRLLVQAEEDFRDRAMQRPAGAVSPPRYMPSHLEVRYECCWRPYWRLRDLTVGETESRTNFWRSATRDWLTCIATTASPGSCLN